MPLRYAVLPPLVGLMMVVAVVAAVQTSPDRVAVAATLPEPDGVVQTVDAQLAADWAAEGWAAPAVADDLTLLRRLSLALHGTVPSLEEIRAFEADGQPRRIERWTRTMLTDERFGRYWSERLARPMVGTATEPFAIFRRDRFTDWLAERLRTDQPWDQTVRHLIADEGGWTDTPSVNFITSQLSDDQIDRNALAARTVRVFLGQRIDCAQCHDHPFDRWKQGEFEGLAACYGQSGLSIGGLTDKADRVFEVQDRETLEMQPVDPAFPFGADWVDPSVRPRQQLADWVTHAHNRRFDRAIVNRTWTLLLGRPLVPGRPVDDLPDPVDGAEAVDGAASETPMLDALADDFRDGDRRLHRLVEAITATAAFRASSQTELPADDIAAAEEVWAVRPLVRLRPEQMIGSMLQAGSIRTIDRDSHWFVRFLRLVRENDFVKAYGDAGEDELAARSATIPQALLRMNGQLARELSEATPLSASGRVSMLRLPAEQTVETAYLVCLTRRPTPEEKAFFAAAIEEAAEADATDQDVRSHAIEDLFWTLFNSPEFSWIR